MTRLLIFKAAILTCVILACVSTVTAQSRKEWRKTEKSTVDRLKDLAGKEYQGVIPGKGNTLPRVEELRGKEENWVTWPGFQRTPSGSRVFIQSTRPIGYEKSEAKNRVILLLKDCHVFLRNNRNPLITSHFTFTPVSRAYLRQKKVKGEKKVELVLELRAKAVPQISQYTDSDGYNYTFIDFPTGNYAPPEPKEDNSFSEENTGFSPVEPAGGSSETSPDNDIKGFE